MYQQYKALCLKKHVKMARTWNTPGCTIAWLSKQVKRRKRSPPEPEPEPEATPEPEPEPEDDIQAHYERKAAKEASKRKPYKEDDVNLSLHERILRAIGRLHHDSLYDAAFTLMKKLQQQQHEAREAEHEAREAEFKAREAEFEAREAERRAREEAEREARDESRSNNLELLGLTQDDEQLIKKAFRRLALIHHPDKNNGCDIQFKRIIAAYEALMK